MAQQLAALDVLTGLVLAPDILFQPLRELSLYIYRYSYVKYIYISQMHTCTILKKQQLSKFAIKKHTLSNVA